MLDEETVEYGVCLILAGLVKRTLPDVWDVKFRYEKEAITDAGFVADLRLMIGGRAWLTIR